MAGQVIMQGFLHWEIPVWIRRLVTMIPSLIVIAIGLDPSRTLVISQVLLSFGLPFAIIPLVRFTSQKKIMGVLVNRKFTTILAAGVAALIVVLNGYLLYSTFTEDKHVRAHFGPLDGSRLAEAAVAPAAVLARSLGSDVTLLHVIEKNAPETIHGETHLTNDEDACHYLDQVVTRDFEKGISVKTHVHTEEVSQVAQSIVQHSEEFRPDLIVMSAHGEGGFHDFVVGSIPQQVISAGRFPCCC